MVSSHRRRLGVLFAIAAIPPGLAGLLALLLGLFPHLQLLSTRSVQAASFIHFGLLGWLAAAVLMALAALLVRRVALGVVLALLVAGLLWQGSWLLPYYTPETLDHQDPLLLAVINISNGEADPTQLIAATNPADVVVIVEHTDTARADLAVRGFTRTFPHAVHEGNGVGGTSIYSRFPLDDLGPAPTIFGSPLVRLHHPTGPLLLMGVHPVNPMAGAATWASDAATLRTHIRAHAHEPLIVAGDFNAIDRHATMRPLLGPDGFRSTADLAGAGFQRTWPTHAYTPFPILGIDHVLVNGPLTALSHRTFVIDGTDHAGLLTEVARRP